MLPWDVLEGVLEVALEVVQVLVMVHVNTHAKAVVLKPAMTGVKELAKHRAKEDVKVVADSHLINLDEFCEGRVNRSHKTHPNLCQSYLSKI